MSFFSINNTLFTILGYPLSYVECLGTIMGICSVWFAAKNNILTWSTGIINVTCFFCSLLPGELIRRYVLTNIFLMASIYGWVSWKKNRGQVTQIYLFLDKDAPHFQDGTRLGIDRRHDLHVSHLNELTESGIPYVMVAGNWQERFDTSVSIINERWK